MSATLHPQLVRQHSRMLEPGRGFTIWSGYATCVNDYPAVLKA
ncbi:MAG: hypothetical protein SNJ75_02810 [Gemmataceae bacterium]